jgi:hypothetical protein
MEAEGFEMMRSLVTRNRKQNKSSEAKNKTNEKKRRRRTGKIQKRIFFVVNSGRRPGVIARLEQCDRPTNKDAAEGTKKKGGKHTRRGGAAAGRRAAVRQKTEPRHTQSNPVLSFHAIPVRIRIKTRIRE